MQRRTPRSTLLPYTTLFRSAVPAVAVPAVAVAVAAVAVAHRDDAVASASARSEEHTSELQSLAYIVCRLLLENTTNYVPAAAGIRRWQALSGINGRKARAGCPLILL